jgi:hypothetical protein
MPDAGVIVPLAIFFAVGLAAAWVVWRVVLVGGQLRREAQRQRAAIEIARRADQSLSELAVIVDEVRRRKVDPEVAEPDLRATAETMQRFSAEASSLGQAAITPSFHAGLAAEIERAERAIELIEHGRGMLTGRAIDSHGEGETAVKRGYLNLLHAREAIRACADEIAAISGNGAGGTSWRRPDR